MTGGGTDAGRTAGTGTGAGAEAGGTHAGAAGSAASANIAAWLERRARAHPDRPAIVAARGGLLRGRLRGRGPSGRGRSVTFAELAGDVARLAAVLRGRGIRPGERVLVFVPMSIDLYTALLGVLHAGAVAVFVDAWAGRRRLEQAIAAAAPAAFIGTPRAQLLRLVSPSLRRVPVQLWAGPGPLRPGRGRGDGAAVTPVDADHHALVTFTTGTTGRPKAAARSHRFLLAQHEVLTRHLGLREDDVDMPTLPVFVLNNLALGVTSVLPSFDPRRPADIDPRRVLAQMRAEGVTTTSGSPAFYQRLVEAVERGDADAIPVRALFTGGAPVFPPLAERLVRATAGTAHVFYGSTEAEPIAAIRASELIAAAAEPGALGVCAGEPVPELEWRLIRPVDGPVESAALAVEPGETGELVVTGAHVLEGYLDNPAATALAKIRDDDGRVWHRTGDGARFDGRRLWLMGRLSQRVERDGRTWWGMAAEARALTVPGVAHAAYLEWPPGSGRALLCVEPEAGGGDPPADLGDRLRRTLDPIPVDEVRVLPIPRDPRHASKTDAGALRQKLGH